jgi:CarboxypepD_reg-like domain
MFGTTNSSFLKNPRIYTAQDIQRYLQGQLSVEEMHALEKAALEDSLLSDAIEGVEISLRKQDSQKLEKDLSELRGRLRERVGYRKKSLLLFSTRYRVGIAASLLIVAGGGMITYYYLFVRPGNQRALAIEKEKITSPGSSSSNLDDSTYVLKETAKTEDAIPQKSKLRKSLTRNSRQMLNSVSRDEKSLPEKKEDTSVDLGVAKIAPPNLPSAASKTSAVDLENEKKEKNEPGAVAGASEKISSSNTKQLANKNFFKGKVIDANNKPIIAASVFLNDLDLHTYTDANGVFFINLPKPADSIVNITINSFGYRPASVAFKNNNASGNIIRLQPGDSSRSSMEYNGYAEDMIEKKGPENLVPSVGWEEYKKYLDRNKKITTSDSLIKGIEVISFGLSGKKTPASFKIEKSLSAAHDAEVIRLIKVGPPWKLLKGKKARARVVVSF